MTNNIDRAAEVIEDLIDEPHLYPDGGLPEPQRGIRHRCAGGLGEWFSAHCDLPGWPKRLR